MAKGVAVPQRVSTGSGGDMVAEMKTETCLSERGLSGMSAPKQAYRDDSGTDGEGVLVEKVSSTTHNHTHTTDFVYPCLYLSTRMHAWYGSFRANHCVRGTGREGWSRRVTKRIASQHVRMPANANVLRTWTLQHRQPLRRINWSVRECMSAHSRTDIGAGCHTYCACRSSRMSRPVALPCQA